MQGNMNYFRKGHRAFIRGGGGGGGGGEGTLLKFILFVSFLLDIGHIHHVSPQLLANPI